MRVLVLLFILLAGCSSPGPIQQAETSVASGRYEEGLATLETLAKTDVKGAREAMVRNRDIVYQRVTRDARSALDAERLDEAEALYQRLLAIDPNNADARVEQLRLQELRKRNEHIAKADGLFRSGDLDGAERVLRGVLLESPANRKALALMRQIIDRQTKSAQTPVLGPEFKKIISLEFKDSNLKDVFDAIWHASGINFVLDRDVKSDTKASIYVRDVTIEEAVNALLMTQQLAKKVINAKSLLIYPKNPQKISEYQDLVVRNFFLAYADAKQIQTMLKTILKTKEVYIDEKRNLLVIRDNREAVDMAEKLIRAHDQEEPEVMLAIDVIEITHSKLNEIGITFPTQIGVGISNPLTLQALRNLNSSGINVGIGGFGATGTSVVNTLNLTNTNSDTNLLANPRIRVRNREKAKIHIGDRLPVVTNTLSTISNTSQQSVNYLDVGLKLEVEPQIMLDDDVVTKINLEVSTATQSKGSSAATGIYYDVGTRNTTTVLTIHDGETQVLAGLIQDNEKNSGSALPGLGDIPLLGRLFSDQTKERNKTEIILAITPHILHNLARPSAELMEYSSGTESGMSGAISSGSTPGWTPPRPVQANATSFPMSGFSAPVQSAPVPTPANPLPNSPMPTPTPTPTQSSGVIPLMDFSPPPGVGSPPITAPPAP
jgi:general secretion pathway protein D